MELGKVNREYKDRLFKFIFGNPENRAWTLSLYNAVNGTNYDNPKAIKYNTIEDAVYMHMKNDLSFIIGGRMDLYEHQSTFAPNIPVRFLSYVSRLYEAHFRGREHLLYGSELQRISRPKFVCFYNGLRKKEDKTIIKLSTLFYTGDVEESTVEQITEGSMDLEVIMLNANYGHNKELLKACRPLNEYAWLIGKIRENKKISEKN